MKFNLQVGPRAHLLWVMETYHAVFLGDPTHLTASVTTLLTPRKPDAGNSSFRGGLECV